MLNFTVNNTTIEFSTEPDLFSPKGLDIGTKLLLESLAKYDLADKNIIDWGCGWGAISMWIAKSYPTSQVLGLDSDIGAVSAAQQNTIYNKLNNIEIIASHGYSKLSPNFSADIVVSNPPTHRGREVVEQMIQQSYKLLNHKAMLVIVVEARLKPWVFKNMKEVFANCKILSRNSKHVVLMSIK